MRGRGVVAREGSVALGEWRARSAWGVGGAERLGSGVGEATSSLAGNVTPRLCRPVTPRLERGVSIRE
jgi:hypothetical protein